MSEEKLIHKLSLGSTEAFEQIYTIYADRLFGYCVKYAKSRELSEEIVQDVFISLWNSRENIKNSSSISAFIFKIAKNRLINIYRQKVASPIYEEYIEYQNRERFSVDNTSDMLEYDDFIKKVYRLVEKLPKTQQEIFKLSVFDGLSNKEICKNLDIADQTVRNKLSLSLKYLRDNLSVFITFFWVQLIIILSIYMSK